MKFIQFILDDDDYEIVTKRKGKTSWRNYVMGNINESSLRNIWKNEAYKELRVLLKFTRMPKGYSATCEDLLSKKIEFSKPGANRFQYCVACPCRWGESGI